MFRIYKILAQTAVRQHRIIQTYNHFDLQRFAVAQRLYSKKNEKDGSCQPFQDNKKVPPCKPPTPATPDCKPKDKHPCVRPVPDCNQGRKPIPKLQECAKPNLMSECPQPACPWEDEDEKYKKKCRRMLMLGLFFTAATLAALLYLYFGPKKEKKKLKPSKKIKRPKVILKNPKDSSEIPKSIPYLLIGGGTASFSAFRAIKSADPVAKVLVITNEGNFPYMRPPLSKEMWFNEDEEGVKKLNFKQWNGSERSLYYEPSDFYINCKDLLASENGGVAVARGWTITHIDVVNKKAYLEDGYEIEYEKCLIATGSLPRNLDIFENADEKVHDKVTLYRKVFDFEELNEIVKEAKTIAIIGGGFLGSELACALARKGKKTDMKVCQIFREAGNMGNILPEYLSFWTTEKVKSEGVQVMSNAEVTGVKLNDQQVVISLSNGKTVNADHVVVSVGVEPNTEIAQKSDLEVDPELGGYIVNTELQARTNLFIAGDCACFYDTKLGRRRVEHHDHAVVTGRLAGENMTGGALPYLHQSMFWSDLGPDVGYEAIGIVDASLPTVGVFAKATDKDNPKAVVTATDEGIRSKTEEEVPEVCKKYLDKKQLEELDKITQNSRKEDSKPKEGEDFGKGVIFYLRDDIVVGIVLWNVFNRMSVARQVLKDERKYDDLNEVAKLFNIHEE